MGLELGRSFWNAMTVLGIVLVVGSAIPFYHAATGYPAKAPTLSTVTPVTFSPITNGTDTETFVIKAPNQTREAPPNVNTIEYEVSGKSITSDTPMNLTVTLTINPAYPETGFVVEPQYVTIDDSQGLSSANNSQPIGNSDPVLLLQLIKNSSATGAVYSTTYHPSNDSTLPEVSNVIRVNNAEQLTGTLWLIVHSTANPNSRDWFPAFSLAVRNETQIQIGSQQDFLLQGQNVQLENDNLMNNAQTQYDNALTIYNNGVVTALTWVIIGFVVADIGVSAYELGDKKRKRGEGDAQNPDDDEDPS